MIRMFTMLIRYLHIFWLQRLNQSQASQPTSNSKR